MKDVPFRDVYLHALVRDEKGEKMSKSKGNIIDPLEMIDKFGADAFRFTLVALTAQGRDIRMSEERIAGYKHFVNKIWNATRFALMNLEDYSPSGAHVSKDDESLPDRWIKHRLNVTVSEVIKSLDEYRFNDAASGSISLSGTNSVTGTWSSSSPSFTERTIPKRNLPRRRPCSGC